MVHLMPPGSEYRYNSVSTGARNKWLRCSTIIDGFSIIRDTTWLYLGSILKKTCQVMPLQE